jgi:hypothetical protein
MSWLKSLRKQAAPLRKLRGTAENGDATKVSLAELAPPITHYLGLVAYLQLEVFEATSRAVAAAPTLDAKETLSTAAGLALEKHQAFVDEIRRRGLEPHAVMQPFTPMIDEYIERIEPSDWVELVLNVYLVAGLFDAFFSELAAGVRDAYASEAQAVLMSTTGREGVAELLAEQIAADPEGGDRLALWGRRIVGDSLLVARSALILSENKARDEEQIEPVFSELIATHIRRMDNLGLTA